jgi:cytoskeletal protein CcmA (bactofilin family)
MSAMSQTTSTEIARGTKIVGEVHGSAELRIHGEVEGRLHVDGSVVITESGKVQGEVHARTVEVGGKMVGNVVGRESVAILANGSLEGDVVSPRMSIADGAFFKGRVEMSGEDAAKPANRPAGAAS